MLDKISSIKRIASLANLTPTNEPQRSYMFDITFFDAVNPDNELKFFVKSIALPGESREPIVVNHLDDTMTFSGRNSSDKRLVITFWDDQTLKIQRFLQDWIELTGNYNERDAVNKSRYTKEAVVYMKDTTDFIVTGKFSLSNCFPIEIGEVNLSYEESGVVEVQATFTFDDRRFEPGYELGFDAEGLLQ